MKVVIEKCDSYEEAEKAVASGLEKLGGIEKFIKKGEKVAIKPNLLQARKPEDAVTTNPEVVRAIIRQVKKVTDDITITESPGIVGSMQGWNNLLEKTGMKKIAEEEGIQVEILKTPKKIVHKGIITNELNIAEEIMQFDKIINIAKLKTHMLTVYTGCVKNMFGIMPGKIKSGMHVRYESPEKFSMMLLDLYMIKKADLNILDGVDGMEGDGPASGDKKHFGIIGMSEDALALDYAVVKGFSMNVPMIKIAEKRNMIPEIEMEGKIEGEMKSPGINIMEKTLLSAVGSLRKKIASRPAVNKEICTKCANCYNICPVGAIKMNPCPEFDYGKCIRCYCCHEMCPEKAIYLKKSLIQKIARR